MGCALTPGSAAVLGSILELVGRTGWRGQRGCGITQQWCPRCSGIATSLLLLLLLLALMACACGGPGRLHRAVELRRAEGVISYASVDAEWASVVARAWSSAEDRVEWSCGVQAPSARLQLHATHHALERATEARHPRWTRGVARGHVIHLLSPRVWPVAERVALASVIAHEWVHVSLDAQTEGRCHDLPPAFAEGWASRAAGQGGERPSLVALRAAASARPDIVLLDPLGAPTDWFYAASHHFVISLFDGHGEDAMCAVLSGVRIGASFELSFSNATGESFSSAVERFAAQLQSR